MINRHVKFKNKFEPNRYRRNFKSIIWESGKVIYKKFYAWYEPYLVSVKYDTILFDNQKQYIIFFSRVFFYFIAQKFFLHEFRHFIIKGVIVLLQTSKSFQFLYCWCTHVKLSLIRILMFQMQCGSISVWCFTLRSG